MHEFKTREDVTKHLAEEHNWEDPRGTPFPLATGPDGTPTEVRASQIVDMDGRPLIPTSEYLAIHRELGLL